jgi:midasin
MIQMLSVFGLTRKAGVIHSTHGSPDNTTIHAHRAAQRFLGNTIGQVQDAQPSISEVGSTWIALARFLLAMYVPDKPVDPASMADSAVRYWQGQHERLSTVMRHHHALEYRTSGNPTNTVVGWLQDRLALTSTELAQARPSLVVAKRDVISVHAFWAETSHFLTEVLHQDKIDHLISSLERGEDASQSREEVVQESITGFCQRLEVGYPAFHDISATLQWALSQMKLGLRLIAYAGRITADTHFEERTKFTNALITVPTIVAVEALRGRSWQGLRHDSPPAAVLALHLQLALLGQKLGERDPDEVRALYDNVLGLWLKDKAATEKANHEAQSLFKSKTVDHDARSELEQEEAEFKALFPTYDDEVDQQSSATNTQKDPKRHLDAVHLRMIALVHLQLCDVRPSESGNASLDQLRISLLEDTFESSSTLPETLDQDSLAFQLRLLHEQHKSTESTSTLSSDNFDFYHDTRVVEVEKAAGYVRSMSVRLGELIEEWPDQMVLQHLRDRCETILRLPLSSPIAQVLTSLEQLLLQSEDWEMYANRHNSLRTYRESLITTIVAWRRLELTCWSTLLQVQSLSFEDQAGEWWPTLYNACIRGALAAAQDEEAITLEHYLDSLVPLVDHFLISSPLGQFARRLSLVQSFDRFTLAIAPTVSTAERDALYRVQLILRTTCDYYGQFSSNIAASLLAQRSALEKDVRAFIKLASWKDINVQALKASAVRTHHQLYKVIRKFREIMRQPIAQHIQTPPKELHVAALPLPLVAFESASASRYDACLPRTAHVGASAQTKNLPNTLSIFVDLALHRILPTQATHDAVIADNLATTIIERAEALAKEAMPVDIPPEKKTLAQKNLLTRKRKAWTDMLKELKRVGFSSAVKPDVLERQRSLRWLREQHTVTSNMTFGMETYFQKLQTVLPDLRLSVVDHHADISSRDMNRAMMFVESSFSVALQARNM